MSAEFYLQDLSSGHIVSICSCPTELISSHLNSILLFLCPVSSLLYFCCSPPFWQFPFSWPLLAHFYTVCSICTLLLHQDAQPNANWLSLFAEYFSPVCQDQSFNSPSHSNSDHWLWPAIKPLVSSRTSISSSNWVHYVQLPSVQFNTFRKLAFLFLIRTGQFGIAGSQSKPISAIPSHFSAMYSLSNTCQLPSNFPVSHLQQHCHLQIDCELHRRGHYFWFCTIIVCLFTCFIYLCICMLCCCK